MVFFFLFLPPKVLVSFKVENFIELVSIKCGGGGIRIEPEISQQIGWNPFNAKTKVRYGLGDVLFNVLLKLSKKLFKKEMYLTSQLF